MYFQDESNISLTAFLGKTWSPCGQTPKAKVTGLRGGGSAMSAISGRGSLVFRLYDKRIASAEVIEFLGQLLRHHPRRHLVVVMDRATPHTSQATQSFIESQPRLHHFYLPAYSPKWNPDEKVWNHLKCQELKSHQAKSKEELKALAQTKLDDMSKNPKLLRGIYFRCCVADFFAMSYMNDFGSFWRRKGGKVFADPVTERWLGATELKRGVTVTTPKLGYEFDRVLLELGGVRLTRLFGDRGRIATTVQTMRRRELIRTRRLS